MFSSTLVRISSVLMVHCVIGYTYVPLSLRYLELYILLWNKKNALIGGECGIYGGNSKITVCKKGN